MKHYHVELHVKIAQGNRGDYAPPTPIFFEANELLPANVDPEKYLRSRLAEELRRHFRALRMPIENFEEGAVKQDIDPLTDDIPF